VSNNPQNQFTQQLGIKHPIIGGPMYPCSNPELVAAVSEAGGIGIVQPISLTYVFGYDYRAGLQFIKSLTSQPIGMNALIEKSSKRYQQRMEHWLDIALEEGVRFFITSLGKPDWVVKKVHQVGGLVYHDVTEKKWAYKAMESNVDGLIAVNNRAGGHAGNLDAIALFDELHQFNLPVICAGGIGSRAEYDSALDIGYAGVQMGTRFIASNECSAKPEYKSAIVQASERDIVLSQRVTGVPVSLINTGNVERSGTSVNPLTRFLLNSPKLKQFMRSFLFLKSMYQLKKAAFDKTHQAEFWQAGKSVQTINQVQSVQDIFNEFVR